MLKSSEQWPESRVKTLKHLVAENLSAAEIAERMGATRNEICGKVYRLGLKFREEQYVATRHSNNAKAVVQKLRLLRKRSSHSKNVNQYEPAPPTVPFVKCLVGKTCSTYRMREADEVSSSSVLLSKQRG